MIDLFRPFIAPAALDMVQTVLTSGYIGEGPMVGRFEIALKQWIGDCVTVNSGTSALTLAYDLAGVAKGSLVIATPMTCLATVMPLAHLGAEIVWADVDPRTGLIEVDDVRALFLQYGPQITAVVAVDYGGQPVDYDALRILCDNNNAVLIGDRAHSFGAYSPASRPHYSAYSFQAIKSLTTGDGGALVCLDEEDTRLARLMRWFGLDRTKGGFRCEQTVSTKGYKFHMNDIAAGIGLANLPHVEGNLTKHRLHAAQYDQAGLGHQSQAGSNWLYTIHVADREGFVKKMAEKGVQCARVHSRCDVHPIWGDYSARPLLGVTEFDKTQCSIPCGWWLSDGDVAHIITSVKESLRTS